MHDSLLHIEHVARLTHIQDRDTTDSVLVEVLRSLVRPATVNLIELIEWTGQLYCFTRAHLTADMVAPSSTPPWVSPEDCPPLSDFPERLACYQRRQTYRYHNEEGGLVVLVPVVTDAETFLLIEVHMAQEPQAELQSLAEGMAQPLVEGMAKIFRNFLNLLDCSERDTLTSLLNRKSFDDTFFKSTRRVQPVSAPMDVASTGQRQADVPSQYWLGVIDIDHFKRVNDGFGHLIGDEVLLLVARIMRSSFRHDDRLYRFGGEEFVVLLRAHDEENASAVFERFRNNVQSYEFPQVGRITVSIGFTRVRDHDTPAAAFERADKVVYLAKENGRNQVRCFEQEPDFADSQSAVDDSAVELF